MSRSQFAGPGHRAAVVLEISATPAESESPRGRTSARVKLRLELLEGNCSLRCACVCVCVEMGTYKRIQACTGTFGTCVTRHMQGCKMLQVCEFLRTPAASIRKHSVVLHPVYPLQIPANYADVPGMVPLPRPQPEGRNMVGFSSCDVNNHAPIHRSVKDPADEEH